MVPLHFVQGDRERDLQTAFLPLHPRQRPRRFHQPYELSPLAIGIPTLGTPGQLQHLVQRAVPRYSDSRSTSPNAATAEANRKSPVGSAAGRRTLTGCVSSRLVVPSGSL